MKVRLLFTAMAVALAALLAGGALAPTPDGAGAAGRASALPNDARTTAARGMELLQQARDEGDPTLLAEAEEALRTSLRMQPQDNADALVGMASLANFRHDFSGSVSWSRRALKVNPSSASAYGLLGDALFELGSVRAAARAYQQMIDVRPDTASYIRASYTQQHAGETAAAIQTMRMAAQAAGPVGETAAFVQHQLGDIFAGQGRQAAAARANRAGIKMAPGFIPPTVGLAEAYLATGRIDAAIPLLERAVRELPALEYVSTLGDVYTAAGRKSEAEATYRQGAESLATYRASGVRPDADFILFYADHGLRPGAALQEAFALYDNRPTAKTADALGWMLHAVGRHREARTYARLAISSSTASSAELYHAAQIERALGNARGARRLLRDALQQDPTFSLLDAPAARRQLAAGR